MDGSFSYFRNLGASMSADKARITTDTVLRFSVPRTVPTITMYPSAALIPDEKERRFHRVLIVRRMRLMNRMNREYTFRAACLANPEAR